MSGKRRERRDFGGVSGKRRHGLEEGRGIEGDLATFEGLKGGEGLDKGGAGAGFDGELPGVAAASVFVEGREGW